MLFNIYYINTFKMYEIKMMINNKMKIAEQQEKQKQEEEKIGAEAEAAAKVGKLFNLKAKAHVGNVTNDTRKFVENFDIKSTKSTMLREVIEKCNSFNNIEKKALEEGMLVKVDSIKVELTNAEEIMGVKVINNKTISMVYEGIDIGKVFDAAVKDYAYIFKATNQKKEKILFKIPVTFENEFESMYSVNDILIGKIGIIGIYKGLVERDAIKNMIDILGESQNNKEVVSEDIEIVNSDEMEKCDDNKKDNLYHYIDIIAIIQELHIDDGKVK